MGCGTNGHGKHTNTHREIGEIEEQSCDLGLAELGHKQSPTQLEFKIPPELPFSLSLSRSTSAQVTSVSCGICQLRHNTSNWLKHQRTTRTATNSSIKSVAGYVLVQQKCTSTLLKLLRNLSMVEVHQKTVFACCKAGGFGESGREREAVQGGGVANCKNHTNFT